MALSSLTRRRLRNFRRNRRAFWSLIIFSALFGLSLFAELLANDKPILVSYRGDWRMPVFQFYPETAFGGDFRTEAKYRDPEVQCLIVAGGVEDCFTTTRCGARRGARDGCVERHPGRAGWMLWPPIPYAYDTISDDLPGPAPSAARRQSLAGHRRHRARRAGPRDLRLPPVGDVRADRDRARLGGHRHRRRRDPGLFRRLDRPDLPAGHRDLGSDAAALHHHHHLCDHRTKFLVLVFLVVLFGWMGLVGRGAGRIPARAQLRICPCRPALGVSNTTIMFRHCCPTRWWRR
jgi:microcin C transport system permease protein